METITIACFLNFFLKVKIMSNFKLKKRGKIIWVRVFLQVILIIIELILVLTITVDKKQANTEREVGILIY